MVPWRWVEIVPLLRLPLCAVSSVVCVVRRFVCRCVIRVWILPARCLASVGTVLAVVCLLFRRAVVLCFWDVVLRCPCGVPVSLPGFCLCFLWLVVRRGCRWLVFYGFPTRRWNRLFSMVSWLLAWCRVAWWRVVVYVCLLLLSTAVLLREDGAACWCGGGLRTQERICTTSFTSQ